MAYLAINGYSVQVVHDDVEMGVENFGSEDVAYDGTWLRTVRARKRVSGNMETPPMARLDAIALQGLLEGLGHTWSFDDSTDYRFSSKGAPTLVVLGTVTYGTSAPSPKYGAGRIGVSGGSVSWALGYTNHWTMMAWKWSGSVWNHYIVRDDGAKWVDGVFTPGASTTFFVVGSGNFALVNGGAATYFDDLVVLPYRVSGDMAVAFGTSTEAFGLLPKLKLSGAIIPEQTSIDGFGMEPAVVSSPAVISGAYDANAASVQFSIREG
jgi:hypothetical protein